MSFITFSECVEPTLYDINIGHNYIFDEESNSFIIKDIDYWKNLGHSYSQIFYKDILRYIDSNGTFNGGRPGILFLNDIITYLYHCECCERHSKEKPGIFSPWIERRCLNNPTNNCNCDCRHLSRFICRTHIDYEKSNECYYCD